MATPRIGLFGSNVGTYASQKKKLTGIDGVAPTKAVIPSVKAPVTSQPSVAKVPQSLITNGPEGHIAAPWSTGFAAGAAAQSSGSSGGILGDVLGGVEGFIGHLGSDVVHTALGLPVGIAYMIEHPIAGVEAAAKATWNDWSPLFHGDVRLWLHNTYEHPLAPILDVASVMTGGAAIAARVTDTVAAVGIAGEAAAAGAGSESALMAGTKTALGMAHRTEAFRAASTAGSALKASSRAVTAAQDAGALAGKASKGMEASTTYERMQKFANPGRYAHQSYMKIAAKLGYTTTDEIHAYADMAMQLDNQARRVYRTGTGHGTWKEVSNNPWTRTRQAQLRKMTNRVADKSPTIAHHIGDKAVLRRWSSTDSGQRAAAVADTMHKEIATFGHAGEALHSLHAHEAAEFMHGHMRNGIVQQSHAITPDANYVSAIDGAVGKSAQFRDITRAISAGGDGLNAVTHEAHYAEANAKAMERMKTVELNKGRDVALHGYLKDEWKTAATTLHPDEALVDANGNWHFTGAADAVSKETAFSSSMIRKIYTKPTQVWKYMLLGLSPRYFVNNFVGNSLMLMAATDPVSMVRAFHGYMNARGLAKDMERSTNETLAALKTKAGQTSARKDAAQAQLDKAVADHKRLSAPVTRRPRKGDTAHQRNILKQQHAAFKANNSAAQVQARTANIHALHRNLKDINSTAAAHDARVTYYTHHAAAVKGGLVGGHWMDKWFAGEYGMGRTMQIEGENDGGLIGKLNQKYSLHGVTHRWADMPQRYMALNYSMKRMPEFQAEYARLRAGGMNHLHAEAKAADKAAESGAVRQLVRNQVNHMFGQYHSFTKQEQAIKQVVPFYAWDRAIATHMQHLITNQSYKVAMGAAIGSLGNVKTREIMGQVPDFMMSVIPAKLLWGPLGAIIGKEPGRLGGLNAYGLNPYSSVADITGMGEALLGQGKFRVGDSLGGQLNPFIQQAAQMMSGTNLQTGAPIKVGAGGPLVQTYLGAFGNIPQVTLLKNLLGYEDSSVTAAGNPTLYKKGTEATLSGLLGAPVKQINVDTAHALYQLQNPGPKKGRKHASFNASTVGLPGM